MEQAIASFDIEIQNNHLEELERCNLLLASLEKKLASLYEKDARQKDALDDGIYTKQEYLQRNAVVQNEITQTLSTMDNLKANLPDISAFKEKKTTFEEALAALQDDSCPAMMKNILLKKCIKKIVYYNDLPSTRGIGRYSKNEFSLDIFFHI